MKSMMIVVTLLATMAMAFNAQAASSYASKPMVNQQQKDLRLAGMIRSSIAFERKLASQKVRVDVQNCVVIVSGEVNSQRHHKLLLSLINQAAGEEVKLATDQLKLTYQAQQRI